MKRKVYLWTTSIIKNKKKFFTIIVKIIIIFEFSFKMNVVFLISIVSIT